MELHISSATLCVGATRMLSVIIVPPQLMEAMKARFLHLAMNAITLNYIALDTPVSSAAQWAELPGCGGLVIQQLLLSAAAAIAASSGPSGGAPEAASFRDLVRQLDPDLAEHDEEHLADSLMKLLGDPYRSRLKFIREAHLDQLGIVAWGYRWLLLHPPDARKRAADEGTRPQKRSPTVLDDAIVGRQMVLNFNTGWAIGRIQMLHPVCDNGRWKGETRFEVQFIGDPGPRTCRLMLATYQAVPGAQLGAWYLLQNSSGRRRSASGAAATVKGEQRQSRQQRLQRRNHTDNTSNTAGSDARSSTRGHSSDTSGCGCVSDSAPHFVQPRGRPPLHKKWDTTTGKWVPLDSVHTHQKAGRNREAAAGADAAVATVSRAAAAAAAPAVAAAAITPEWPFVEPPPTSWVSHNPNVNFYYASAAAAAALPLQTSAAAAAAAAWSYGSPYCSLHAGGAAVDSLSWGAATAAAAAAGGAPYLAPYGAALQSHNAAPEPTWGHGAAHALAPPDAHIGAVGMGDANLRTLQMDTALAAAPAHDLYHPPLRAEYGAVPLQDSPPPSASFSDPFRAELELGLWAEHGGAAAAAAAADALSAVPTLPHGAPRARGGFAPPGQMRGGGGGPSFGGVAVPLWGQLPPLVHALPHAGGGALQPSPSGTKHAALALARFAARYSAQESSL
ncbi:hypothetical protein JKP88DRAFT_249488 [Tribonema minus]|uniref:Uncharacterized protein n=1 Tax=Tribonema minus TaxID=303371 RepID=A0A835YJC2_9STRA|nr:hypothetical protein JKP88DRAFT_249488 [Tribonema minus]